MADPGLIADGDGLGTDALRYGQDGYEVFPLRGKVPAIAKVHGGNGVLDATTDLRQIAAWWRTYPNANIGGRVPVDVVVVDIDPRSGGLELWGQLVTEHGDAPTRTVWSGRGDGGRHLHYRHPGGAVRGSIGLGLDVKTSRGYTVLPPSLHPATGLPYRWEDPTAPILDPPAWLIKRLTPPQVRQAPRASQVPQVAPMPPILMPAGICDDRYTHAGLVAAVETAAVGERNHKLNWAAYRLGIDYRDHRATSTHVRAAIDALAAAALRAGLGETETERTIISGLKAGAGGR